MFRTTDDMLIIMLAHTVHVYVIKGNFAVHTILNLETLTIKSKVTREHSERMQLNHR